MTVSANVTQGPGLWNWILFPNSFEATEERRNIQNEDGRLNCLDQWGSLPEAYKEGRREVAAWWAVALAYSNI